MSENIKFGLTEFVGEAFINYFSTHLLDASSDDAEHFIE